MNENPTVPPAAPGTPSAPAVSSASPASPPAARQARVGLFRRIALERYRAPQQADAPWLLEAWRPAPFWIGGGLLGLVVLGLVACWP